MFEMSMGYLIGMLTGYLIFRRSVVEIHGDLKDYLETLVDEVHGGRNHE